MKVLNDCNPFVPELYLFHNKKKYDKFCRKMYNGEIDSNPNAHAETFYWGGVAAVLMNPKKIPSGSRLNDEIALVYHEAVHCAYRHFRELGVEMYDEEIFAYAVQTIGGALAYYHTEWKEKHG